MKRRFEFVSGSSSKFWEATINGCSVTISFGRIGTAGQQQTKEFADATAAQRHVDTQIAAKVKKGYLETVPA